MKVNLDRTLESTNYISFVRRLKTMDFGRCSSDL